MLGDEWCLVSNPGRLAASGRRGSLAGSRRTQSRHGVLLAPVDDVGGEGQTQGKGSEEIAVLGWRKLPFTSRPSWHDEE